MCAISLPEPKCRAYRQVCGGLFYHSFIYPAKERRRVSHAGQDSHLSEPPFPELRTLGLLIAVDVQNQMGGADG